MVSSSDGVPECCCQMKQILLTRPDLDLNYQGCKVFKTIDKKAPFSYKFVSMILACTGGGIMVPIFINGIPVPLAQDAYPIAIFTSFLLHTYFPILREVLELSPVFKVRF